MGPKNRVGAQVQVLAMESSDSRQIEYILECLRLSCDALVYFPDGEILRESIRCI